MMKGLLFVHGALFVKNDKHVTESHLLVAKNIRNVIETRTDFCLQGLAMG